MGGGGLIIVWEATGAPSAPAPYLLDRHTVTLRLSLCCHTNYYIHYIGPEGMSFLFTWLRMSSNKLLTWARRANYQSKVGGVEGVSESRGVVLCVVWGWFYEEGG